MLQANPHSATYRLRKLTHNLSEKPEVVEVRYRITRMIEVPDNPHIYSTAKTDCPKLMCWAAMFLNILQDKTKVVSKGAIVRETWSASQAIMTSFLPTMVFLQSHRFVSCHLRVPGPTRGDDLHEAFGRTTLSGRVTWTCTGNRQGLSHFGIQ